MRRALALLAAAALLAAGCRAAKGAQVWSVYNKKGVEVLRMKDEPGPLTSKAMPSGAAPVTHPFLTAASQDPMEEDALRAILEGSKDFDDFVRRLKDAGYTVSKSERPL